MDLRYTPEEERFRAELRAWLAANPPGPEPETLEEWAVSYTHLTLPTIYSV